MQGIVGFLQHHNKLKPLSDDINFNHSDRDAGTQHLFNGDGPVRESLLHLLQALSMHLVMWQVLQQTSNFEDFSHPSLLLLHCCTSLIDKSVQ